MTRRVRAHAPSSESARPLSTSFSRLVTQERIDEMRKHMGVTVS